MNDGTRGEEESLEVETATAGRLPAVARFPAGASGGVALLHGLGDHARRYGRLMGRWAEAGLASVAADLPGHGRARGQRGHLPDLRVGGEAVEASLTLLRERVPGAPLAVAAHSMGGLLVLDHLARGGRLRGCCLWLSSPLLEPAHGRAAWMQRLAKCLAPVLPRLPLTTGVRLGDCYDPAATGKGRAQERASGTHNVMSLGTAAGLLAAAHRVAACKFDALRELPVLLTQGEADRICPPHYARALFERLPAVDKTWLAVPGARHEPWQDGTVAETLTRWLCERLGGAPAQR